MRFSAVLLLAAAGFLGCDHEVEPSRCAPNSILATNQDGQLVCTERPRAVGAPPGCATALTSDGHALLCSTPTVPAPGVPTDTKVATLDKNIDALRVLMGFAQKSRPGYVGVTSVTSYGGILVCASLGLPAARRLCESDYGRDAHMCTMEELYQSVATGVITATSTIPSSWVYAPNWNEPIPNPESPQKGVSDSCSAYTDHSGSLHHSGILVEWGPLADGTPGFRWRGGLDARCLFTRKIACCQ